MFQKRAKIWLNIPKNEKIEQKCSKNRAKNLAKYPQKWKNRSRTRKIPPGKIEYNGQKLTYFKKEKIKGLFGPKNNLGLCFSIKKDFF